MDLRRTRTFVTVAELGTVSKAALRLRIAQPALSRQISDLEQELGLKLFDRIGRRLLLTGEGEQLLSDCRGLLNYASAVSERAQLLRHGDTGVLKVAASSQNLESVVANFLHRYAQRYPRVEVKLFDAIGPQLLEMLERGEIHVAQSSLHVIQRDQRRFGSLRLRRSRSSPLAIHGWLLARARRSRLADWRLIRCFSRIQDSCFAGSSMRLAASRDSSQTSSWKAARPTRCWRWPKPGTAWPFFRRLYGLITATCEFSP
jgi:DNA-binding transcriptional LysR family regulator